MKSASLFLAVAGRLVAALKEGKGHPVEVAASDAELKAMAKTVLSARQGPVRRLMALV